MFKRLLLILTLAQVLLTSTWASAHMAAETHSCFGSPHIELNFSDQHSDRTNHHHGPDVTDSHEQQEGEHIHLCVCALGQTDLSLQAADLDCPIDSHCQILSDNLGPDTPPPTH